MQKSIFAVLIYGFFVSSFTHGSMAQITNIRLLSPACIDQIQIVQNADGATVITLIDAVVQRGALKPFIRCKLGASLVIPKGYFVSSVPAVSANISGIMSQKGDQIAGKLVVETGRTSVRDFRFIHQTSHDEEDISKEEKLPMQVELPQFPKACSEQKEVRIRMQLETMINYRLDGKSTVKARLENMIFSPIHLNLCPSS